MTRLGLLLGATLFAAPAAFAQSEADFVAGFAGEWMIHDRAQASGAGPCRITLSAEAAETGHKVTVAECAAPLSGLTHWLIAEGQLRLQAGETVVASLGGSRNRISGTNESGAPYVLDRADNALGVELAAAIGANKCLYRGASSDCAPTGDLAFPAPGADGLTRVRTLVNLNVRGEPRDDAPVLGVAPQEACIVADVCVETSDGTWCRARFGETTGWLKKFALRQSKWPVITYSNGCPAEG